MELSASIGSTAGPFIAAGLSYFFGIVGPFVIFCNLLLLANPSVAILYLIVFPFLFIIPSDEVMEEALTCSP